jgi:syntaxin 1B/2/3
VNDRHRAIQQIVAQLMELDELFKDLETLVVQQDPAVVKIEERGQEVTTHVENANKEMSNAIGSARSRNRKKWWCLLVVRMCFPPHLFPPLLLLLSL